MTSRTVNLQREDTLPFFVKGTDTSGTVSLRRDNAAGAVKKAKELLDDGSWDIEITSPEGLVYPLAEFEAIQDSHGATKH
jgi:hypothetical protein